MYLMDCLLHKCIELTILIKFNESPFQIVFQYLSSTIFVSTHYYLVAQKQLHIIIYIA